MAVVESRSYAPIADRYEQVRGGHARAGELAAGLLPWIPAGLVIDVGAGTGIVAEHLRRAGVDLVACDLSPEMLRQASGRLPGRLHVGDATALALGDDTVDAVLFVWVLHHVGDVGAALTESLRVLRPGGRVIAISGMADPADDDLSPIWERLLDHLRPDRHGRERAVTAEALAAGFALEHDGSVPVTFSTTPNGLADAITERLFAPLWDLPARRWTTTVEPAIGALRALPDPDEPRQRALPHRLLVLRAPPSQASRPEGTNHPNW